MLGDIFSGVVDFFSAALPVLLGLYWVFTALFKSKKKSNTSHTRSSPKKGVAISKEEKGSAWEKFEPELNKKRQSVDYKQKKS